MTVSHDPIFFQTLRGAPAQIVNADGTGKVTVFTPGASGSRVYAIGLASTEIAGTTRTPTFWLTRSGTDYQLSTVQVPGQAGADGTNTTISGMRTDMWPSLPVDNDGQRYINVEAGDVIKASVAVAVGVGKQLAFHFTAADL